MKMLDKAVYEVDAQVAVAANATAVSGQLITVPEVNGVRPIGFSIIDAAADLSVEVSEDPDESNAVELTAANILPNSGDLYFELGPDTKIAMEAAAGATTANIRWFYPAGATLGHASSPKLEDLNLRSQSYSQVIGTPAEDITIPDDAIALVIESVSAGGASNGCQLTLDSGQAIELLQSDDISSQHPFVMYLRDDMDFTGVRVTADCTLTGKWLIAL